jgi:hypothetical protein
VIIATYISRAKSPDDARTVCALLAQAYTLRLSLGLIRADCAIKVDDPCVVIGVLYWGSEAARDAVERLEERRTAGATYAPYLVAPAEVSVYEVV